MLQILSDSPLPGYPDIPNLEIRVTNVSSHRVTAIAVSTPTGGQRFVDFAERGGLLPGQYREFMQGYSPTLSQERRILSVLAALFEGGVEGEPTAIDTLRFMRLGRMVEERRLLSVLAKVQCTAIDDTALRGLRAETHVEVEPKEEEIDSFAELSHLPPEFSLATSGSSNARLSTARRHALLSGVQGARVHVDSMLGHFQKLKRTEVAEAFAEYLQQLKAQVEALRATCQQDLGGSL